MKKVKVFLLSAFMLLVFTGCGTKTLECTNTMEYTGFSLDQVVTIKFKNEVVNSLKMEINVFATNDTYRNSWDDVADTYDKMYGSFGEKEGVKVTVKNNADKHEYLITMEADLRKAKEADLEELSLSGIAGSKEKYKDVKKSAGAAGFTCK